MHTHATVKEWSAIATDKWNQQDPNIDANLETLPTIVDNIYILK